MVCMCSQLERNPRRIAIKEVVMNDNLILEDCFIKQLILEDCFIKQQPDGQALITVDSNGKVTIKGCAIVPKEEYERRKDCPYCDETKKVQEKSW